MSIVFDQVTKAIGKNTVIDHISCEIHDGQITGLQGINGSGKTMMMRLIAGLIYPTKGQVKVNDKVIGKDLGFPPSLGIMLENPAFLNAYSGYGNLKLLAAINGMAGPEEINEALVRVGLFDAKDKKYRKYSLGMKQRLGIAAAIMEHPAILLLDEPTNSLDTSGVELVKTIVQEEKSRGATVVLSCHDGIILEELTDEILSIEAGKLVSTRKAKEVVRL